MGWVVAGLGAEGGLGEVGLEAVDSEEVDSVAVAGLAVVGLEEEVVEEAEGWVVVAGLAEEDWAVGG